MIEPLEVEINGRHFVISKFDAIAGREIIATYPTTGLPKLGEYKSNEAIMLKLMKFVAVITEGGNQVKLSTPELVNNHTGDWETLVKLEMKTLEYNCSFFQNGRVSGFLNDIMQKLPAKILETLMDLSQSSLQKEKLHSTNSEQSTV